MTLIYTVDVRLRVLAENFEVNSSTFQQRKAFVAQKQLRSKERGLRNSTLHAICTLDSRVASKKFFDPANA